MIDDYVTNLMMWRANLTDAYTTACQPTVCKDTCNSLYLTPLCCNPLCLTFATIAWSRRTWLFALRTVRRSQGMASLPTTEHSTTLLSFATRNGTLKSRVDESLHWQFFFNEQKVFHLPTPKEVREGEVREHGNEVGKKVLGETCVFKAERKSWHYWFSRHQILERKKRQWERNNIIFSTLQFPLPQA